MFFCFLDIHNWIYSEDKYSEDRNPVKIRRCKSCGKKQKSVYYTEFDDVIDIYKEAWVDDELSTEEKRNDTIESILK